MKILNLYAGIGGNRKLWGDEHEITAVESIQGIAEAYKELWPNDTVIVADAHQYLLDHYKEFDFIWSSPPCPTHSKLSVVNVARGRKKYPDMSLYQEIIWLKHFCYVPWVVENVVPFYKPLVTPTAILDRHCFWSNYFISKKYIARNYGADAVVGHNVGGITGQSITTLSRAYGITLPKDAPMKRKLLRNCVIPELGLHVFNCRDNLKQEVLL